MAVLNTVNKILFPHLHLLNFLDFFCYFSHVTFGILRFGVYNGFNYRVNYQREKLNRRSEFRKADVLSVISPSSEQSETLETSY